MVFRDDECVGSERSAGAVGSGNEDVRVMRRERRERGRRVGSDMCMVGSVWCE